MCKIPKNKKMIQENKKSEIVMQDKRRGAKINLNLASKFILILGFLILVFLLNINFISAEITTSVCCERTLENPAWCQNSQPEQCDANYRQTPTSCDATSFCKVGCCYDSKQGICTQDVSQVVCDNSGGTFDNNRECNTPQCTLGCCILGDQSSFVTLTRCKKLSSFFGLNTDFRGEVTNEADCALLGNSQEKGACLVIGDDTSRTCVFGTRGECRDSGGEFHKDYLCSAEELGTDCGPSEKTTCVDGKDDVYFLDTCGNTANIYDASKIDNREYWNKIVKEEDSCKFSSDTNCGNCDYFDGSMCSEYNAGLGKKPSYGNNICKSLDCKNIGKKHGESWCTNEGIGTNGAAKVGSRSYRHICVFGEEISEPCEDYRKQICYEEEIGTFSQAACRENSWADCIGQTKKTDCENSDVRDCYWTYNYRFIGQGEETPEKKEDTNELSNLGKYIGIWKEQKFKETDIYQGVKKRTADDLKKYPISDFPDLGICLPKYPPGFDLGTGDIASSKSSGATPFAFSGAAFSETGSGGFAQFAQGRLGTSAQGAGQCAAASAQCTVVYEGKGIGAVFGDDYECKENCECLANDWGDKMNSVCTSLGDCGAYMNYLGKTTFFGYEWKYTQYDGDYGDFKKSKTISQALAGAVA